MDFFQFITSEKFQGLSLVSSVVLQVIKNNVPNRNSSLFLVNMTQKRTRSEFRGRRIDHNFGFCE